MSFFFILKHCWWISDPDDVAHESLAMMSTAREWLCSSFSSELHLRGYVSDLVRVTTSKVLMPCKRSSLRARYSLSLAWVQVCVWSYRSFYLHFHRLNSLPCLHSLLHCFHTNPCLCTLSRSPFMPVGAHLGLLIFCTHSTAALNVGLYGTIFRHLPIGAFHPPSQEPKQVL